MSRFIPGIVLLCLLAAAQSRSLSEPRQLRPRAEIWRQPGAPSPRRALHQQPAGAALGSSGADAAAPAPARARTGGLGAAQPSSRVQVSGATANAELAAALRNPAITEVRICARAHQDWHML
jgi:hypothetical protein